MDVWVRRLGRVAEGFTAAVREGFGLAGRAEAGDGGEAGVRAAAGGGTALVGGEGGGGLGFVDLDVVHGVSFAG